MANKDVNTDVNESDKIPDALWAEIEPLLPPEKPKPKASRPRMGSRKAMDARFYILGTGCQWKALPHRLGAPSAVDDRFQERPKAGVFHRIWEWIHDQSAIGWEKTGPNPTDGGKSGSKSSVLTEGDGIPLAVAIDGANDQDMKLTEPTLKAIAIERPNITD